MIVHTYNSLIQESKTGDCQESEVNLDYIVNLRSARAIYSKTLSQSFTPKRLLRKTLTVYNLYLVQLLIRSEVKRNTFRYTINLEKDFSYYTLYLIFLKCQENDPIKCKYSIRRKVRKDRHMEKNNYSPWLQREGCQRNQEQDMWPLWGRILTVTHSTRPSFWTHSFVGISSINIIVLVANIWN